MYIQGLNFGAHTTAGSLVCEGKYSDHEHLHQFGELIRVLDGEVTVTVGTESINAVKGDIIIVPPFALHSFDTPEYCHIWICVYSNDLLLGFLTSEEMYAFRTTARFVPSDALAKYIEGICFTEVCREFDGTHASCRVVRAALAAIFEEYLRGAPSISGASKDRALSRILIYIEEHYREPLTIASVGEAVGYSPYYVSHCLEELSNINFRSFVNILRVEHAKTLLLRTDFRMLDIALESGFTCERSFFRVFLRVVGMTPKQYRESKENA